MINKLAGQSTNSAVTKRKLKWVGVLMAFLLVMGTISACSGGGNNNTPTNNSPSQGDNGGNGNNGGSGNGGASGNGNGDSGGNNGNGGDQEPVTIRFISPHDDNMKKFVEEFMKKYPWITVETIFSAEGHDNSVLEKVAALQAAGTPGDIVRLGDLTAAVKDGVLADISDYLANDPSMEGIEFRPGILDNYTLDGKKYGVPIGYGSLLIYVNKDLLDKYGLEMPANDWTYDDLWEMAREATNPADGDYGLATNVNSQTLAMIYTVANGSAPNFFYIDEARKQSVLNTPAVQRDLNTVKEIILKDKLIPTDEEAQALGIDNTFVEGKALFSVEGIWVLGGFKQNLKFNWDVLPLPKGAAKQVTPHFVPSFSMLSSSKQKDAAFKFLSFMGSKELGKLNIDLGGVPFTVDADMEAYLASNPNMEGKNVDGLKYNSELCCSWSGALIPGYGEYSPQIDNFHPTIIRRGGDIASLSAEIAEVFNRRTAELRAQFGME